MVVTRWSGAAGRRTGRRGLSAPGGEGDGRRGRRRGPHDGGRRRGRRRSGAARPRAPRRRRRRADGSSRAPDRSAASARIARTGRSATPERARRAWTTTPASRCRAANRPASAKSPGRRHTSSQPVTPGGIGKRTAVTSSSGRRVVLNEPSKRSAAATRVRPAPMPARPRPRRRPAPPAARPRGRRGRPNRRPWCGCGSGNDRCTPPPRRDRGGPVATAGSSSSSVAVTRAPITSASSATAMSRGRDPAGVDHHLGTGQAEVHQRHQALAARDHRGVVTVLGQGRQHPVEGGRIEIGERSRLHLCSGAGLGTAAASSHSSMPLSASALVFGQAPPHSMDAAAMPGQLEVPETEGLAAQFVLLEQAGPEQQRVVGVEACSAPRRRAARAGDGPRWTGPPRAARWTSGRRRGTRPSSARRFTSSGSSTARTPCWMRWAPSSVERADHAGGPASSPAWGVLRSPASRARANASAKRLGRPGASSLASPNATTPAVGVAHREAGLRHGVGRVEGAVGGDHAARCRRRCARAADARRVERAPRDVPRADRAAHGGGAA